jgi:hypothetical protein
MDAGMIRRIQHFTTQNIAVATVPGLEPKSPEPRMFPGRPAGGPSPERGRFGGKPFGAKPFGPKPSFGNKPFAARAAQGDAPRNPFDRPAGDRRPHDSAGPRKSGFKPHPVGGRPSRFER